MIKNSNSISQILQKFIYTRSQTESLCASLLTEDFILQAVPNVSPTKWHIAHSSWFFEQFLLLPHQRSYRPYHADYSFLFNSYYEAVGKRVERSQRGLLSRPPLEEVRAYRSSVTKAVAEFMSDLTEEKYAELLPLLILGINHEQQHQELILTDIKYCFYQNPLKPAFKSRDNGLKTESSASAEWLTFDSGIREIGASPESSAFSFDHERPRHREFLETFSIQNSLVTNGEYLEFVKDGGYQDVRLWLSDAWEVVCKNGWNAPLYWEKTADSYRVFTLYGMQPLELNEPVSHVSFYEAQAYAQWRGLRLPTEAEWEVAVEDPQRGDKQIQGEFLESQSFHPTKVNTMWGSVWNWTSSSFLPYPGFKPLPAALGEYNQKFMSNQMVLRGGSCATPQSHIRSSYRNFFAPESRWQFSGIRLAK
jgi:ergothioneine biosynthesis protein EgtB